MGQLTVFPPPGPHPHAVRYVRSSLVDALHALLLLLFPVYSIGLRFLRSCARSATSARGSDPRQFERPSAWDATTASRSTLGSTRPNRPPATPLPKRYPSTSRIEACSSTRRSEAEGFCCNFFLLWPGVVVWCWRHGWLFCCLERYRVSLLLCCC